MGSRRGESGTEEDCGFRKGRIDTSDNLIPVLGQVEVTGDGSGCFDLSGQTETSRTSAGNLVRFKKASLRRDDVSRVYFRQKGDRHCS